MKLARIAPALLALAAPLLIAYLVLSRQSNSSNVGTDPGTTRKESGPSYQPRRPINTSGYAAVSARLHWPSNATLHEIAAIWHGAGERNVRLLDDELSIAPGTAAIVTPWLMKAIMQNYSGKPEMAGKTLAELRSAIEADDRLAAEWLYTIVYYQGVTSLRIGENENCVKCCGAGACILPIARTAVHSQPAGSRNAIVYFTQYLEEFPEDLEVRWLLNLAHMTLGTYPNDVDPRYLVRLDGFLKSEFDIGRFENVSSRVGLGDRQNWAGGAVMDDFDGDGHLDLIVTSSDPEQRMALYRNSGRGTFEDRTAAAGLDGQLGGLYCVQADFDNDGHLDLFVARGGWLTVPMRPSLLRNTGDGRFEDVTGAAGMLDPTNAGCASFADYDGDGRLDLFVGSETGKNRLYRNRGGGQFEDVASAAGVAGPDGVCKGSAWIDYDRDGRPDLFLNHFGSGARLYQNRGDGTFRDVTASCGIDGPRYGFSCWTFDYDNDGWPDIFATSFDRTVAGVVQGLTGQPLAVESNRLYRNLEGKGFQDVTRQAGLSMVFSPMGSNYGDFDNDGYLDFYLGTGDPELSMLVPNRMFRNVGGRRFADITASSGTGLLQKGHAVACGDWDRDGAVDVFVETGGTIPGDQFSNTLFQNPGPRGHWLNLKLIGMKSNRSAIGARIKVVTAGPNPQTIHWTVSSGSSFGANPLEVHVGIGAADRVDSIEVYWPTTQTTQVFRDIAANQYLVVTELSEKLQYRIQKPVALPRIDR